MAETCKIAVGASILPSVFVSKDSASRGGTVSPTASQAKMFGISQAATRNAPYPLLDDGYAGLGTDTLNASSQDHILVYTYPDKEVLLWMTSSCNPGDAICADTGNLGKGLVTATDNLWIGATAKQSGIAGDLVPVDLTVPARY